MTPFRFFKTIFLFILSSLIFSSPALAATCLPGEIPYRYGGDCEQDTENIHSNLSEYQITCSPKPKISVNITSSSQPSGLNITSLSTTYPKTGTGTMNIEVTAQLDQLQLGGFGANAQILSQYSPDAIAQVYPYQSLFDLPQEITEDTPREAFRTFWRSTSFESQAKAKAVYLRSIENTVLPLPSEGLFGFLKNSISGKPYQDSTITFTHNNSEETIAASDLASQIVKNPLTTCLLIVDKTIDFKFPGILGFLNFELPLCNYQQAYKSLSFLRPRLKSAYDALYPTPFDNFRGYLGLQDEVNPNIESVYTEDLPYISAVNYGLNDDRIGLLNQFTPQAYNDLRSHTSDSTQKEDRPLFNDIINKIITKDLSTFDMSLCQENIDAVFLTSPLTYPKSVAGSNPLVQIVTVPVDITVSLVNSTTSCPPGYILQSNSICYEDATGTTTLPITSTTEEWRVISPNPIEGRPIIVFNNPKSTDIQQSLAQDPTYLSLTSFLTPNFTHETKTDPDNNIESPITMTTNPGSGVTVDPNPPVVSRLGQRAHTDLCTLKNFWLTPAGLQRGTYQDCETLNITTGLLVSNPNSSGACQQGTPNTTPQNVLDRSQQKNISPLIAAFEIASETFKVPVCVLKGVAWIETGVGGYVNWSSLATNTELQKRYMWQGNTEIMCDPATGDEIAHNQCSARGPFQITTGPSGVYCKDVDPLCPYVDPQHCTYSCNSYCNSSGVVGNIVPNAWGSVGSASGRAGATPTNLYDALMAAAKLLNQKASGPSSINWTEAQIVSAGNNYYGTSSPDSLTENLGGPGATYGNILNGYCKGEFPPLF